MKNVTMSRHLYNVARGGLEEEPVTLRALHRRGPTWFSLLRGAGKGAITELERLFKEAGLPNWDSTGKGPIEVPVEDSLSLEE